MKEFSIIVRNKSTGKLQSITISAENQMRAISNCMRQLPSGKYEYMHLKEKHIKRGKK